MTYRPKNVSMSNQDWAAWARLCKRFPELPRQIDHAACLMAAHAEGRVNSRVHIQKTIGGWIAFVIGYAPFLKDGQQKFCLNQDEKYPNRFDRIEDAVEAALTEADNLINTLREKWSEIYNAPYGG